MSARELSPLRAVLQRAADRRLADWLTSRPPFKPPEPAADWETVVRDAVRRELGKATQS